MKTPTSKGRPRKNESRPLHSQGMWWRMYARDLQRRDIQTLPDDVFRTWVGLGCLASLQNGLLPSIRDAAFELRMPEHTLQNHIGLLIDAGLVQQSVVGNPALTMAGWSYRQFGSDNSTQRTQKHKYKKTQSADNQLPPDTGNVPVNVPENDFNIVSHSASTPEHVSSSGGRPSFFEDSSHEVKVAPETSPRPTGRPIRGGRS